MQVIFRIQAPDAPPRDEARDVRARLLIGRSPACDLVLEDRRVSNRHVLIEAMDGRLFATDQESANGTRVRRRTGELVTVGRARLALEPGDVLRVGRVEVLLTAPDDDEPPPTQEMAIPASPPDVADSIEEIDPLEAEEEGDGEVPLEALEAQRDALRARLAAQEAAERTGGDPEVSPLQARLAEGQAQIQRAEQGVAEAARRVEAVVAQIKARRQEAERLEAERLGLNAAVEVALERALRLEARLDQVRAELVEARGRHADLQRVVPALEARYALLVERQRAEVARRRPGERS